MSDAENQDGDRAGGAGGTGDLRIRAFAETDAEQVIALWSRCGLVRPWTDPRKDIARKLLVQRDLFMVGENDGRVVAAVMVGYDGHRGWVHRLAVEPELQGKGLGRRMMAEAERRLMDLGCPKMQLHVREDNLVVLDFYRRLGFAEEAVVTMSKRLCDDESR